MFFFFQAEDGIRDADVTGVQTCALPILLEGMAAGCVVVGSRVVGVQEVVRPGDNGLLAAHADPESLADALQQALQDDEAALRMAATARQEALSHYSLQRMTGQYEDLFARLLQGERP